MGIVWHIHAYNKAFIIHETPLASGFQPVYRLAFEYNFAWNYLWIAVRMWAKKNLLKCIVVWNRFLFCFSILLLSQSSLSFFGYFVFFLSHLCYLSLRLTAAIRFFLLTFCFVLWLNHNCGRFLCENSRCSCIKHIHTHTMTAWELSALQSVSTLKVLLLLSILFFTYRVHRAIVFYSLVFLFFWDACVWSKYTVSPKIMYEQNKYHNWLYFVKTFTQLV